MREQEHVIPVNPALLGWARSAAGLSLREAVLRAKITSPRRRKDEEPVTAEDRLVSWEAGQDTPSLPQLKALAKAYRRPLVTFFLPEPPAQAAPLTDFRTLPDTPSESPEFAALKRRIFRLHRALCAIAEDERTEALPFVGSCTTASGVSTVVDSIRKTLAIEPTAERRRSSGDAFDGLRDKAQAAGVYVVLMGNLGSHHSNAAPDEFCGIALAERRCRSPCCRPS